MNYDGVVNAADYLLTDSSYLALSGATPATDPAVFAAGESEFGAQ